VEVADGSVPEGASPRRRRLLGPDRLLRHLRPVDHGVALDREGGWMSLEEFADFISGLGLQGKSEVNFIIGVTLGLSGDILKSTYRRLSFS